MTTERQKITNRKPSIYAVMGTGLAEMPVVVERGPAEYMSMFVTGNPEGRINWYGLVESIADFVRLGFQQTANEDGTTTYSWTYADAVFGNATDNYHRSPGDVFASWVFDPTTNVVLEDDSDVAGEGEYFTYEELKSKSLRDLRKIAMDNGVDYYQNITRVKLAMLLNAPTNQELRCPHCRVRLCDRHFEHCTISFCLVTGKNRVECRALSRDDHYCGLEHWIGFLPAVLESFAYNITPERVIAECVWDKENEVFVRPEEHSDVDETYEEEIPTVADLTAKLQGALTESVAAATEEDSVKETAEKIGVPTEDEDRHDPLFRPYVGFMQPEPDIEIELGTFVGRSVHDRIGIDQTPADPPTPSTGTNDAVSGPSVDYSGPQAHVSDVTTGPTEN